LAFLHPRPGLTREEFERYWRTVHGPLVATSPDYGRWRRRYVQNHVIGAGPVGGVFSGYGMAQFDLPGDEPNENAYAASDLYQRRVRQDELRFIDMERTFSMSATASRLRSGEGSAKVVIMLGDTPAARSAHLPRPDRAASAAIDRFLDHTIAGILATGATLNRVLPGTVTLPGARVADTSEPVTGLGRSIDAVVEIWFTSEAALHEACADSDGWSAFLDVDGIAQAESFVAEELVFFDGGPTALAVEVDA
jgi:hypothetical protein